MSSKKDRGFTLLELILVIALLGILAAIAMPSYKNFIDNQKIRSALNEWQSAFYFAQKEAMRIKAPVTLCGSADGNNCKASPDAANFSDGWIIISGARVLQESAQTDPRIEIAVGGNQFTSSGVVFLSTGRIRNHAGGDLTVRLNSSAVQPRVLTITSGGRLIGEKR